ncbi:hypothetical protein GC170_18350 [bacterium]|nr:hypothetical protein [bacterium]
MPIELGQSGFYEWQDHPFWRQPDPPGAGLGVRSDRIGEFVDHFVSGGFEGIFGHKGFGFEQADLNFLRRTPQAKWLWFWDSKLNDIEAIYELNELKYAGINDKRPGIDFSRLPALSMCVNHWNARDTGFEGSLIETYILWRCNPRDKSCEKVGIPRNVRSLELNWANPGSLAGFPVLNALKRIEFHYCRNLHDLSELPRIAPNLEALVVSHCRKCDSGAGVVDHPSLLNAFVNGRVVIDRRGHATG